MLLRTEKSDFMAKYRKSYYELIHSCREIMIDAQTSTSGYSARHLVGVTEILLGKVSDEVSRRLADGTMPGDRTSAVQLVEPYPYDYEDIRSVFISFWLTGGTVFLSLEVNLVEIRYNFNFVQPAVIDTGVPVDGFAKWAGTRSAVMKIVACFRRMISEDRSWSGFGE